MLGYGPGRHLYVWVAYFLSKRVPNGRYYGDGPMEGHALRIEDRLK